MPKKNKKKGFSLIEVMVAMAVIVLVVFSATQLLVSIIRSNTSNVNTMIAQGLAQEGLEAVRNIRDSDWLLGATFQGDIKTINTTNKPWLADLPVIYAQTAYFKVDFQNLGDIDNTENVNSAALSQYAPWKLEALDGSNPDSLAGSDATTIYKKSGNTGTSEVRYTTDPVGSDPTPFHRYLMISAVQYGNQTPDQPPKKYRVTSVVAWSEFGRDRQVRLDTELTDWKENLL